MIGQGTSPANGIAEVQVLQHLMQFDTTLSNLTILHLRGICLMGGRYRIHLYRHLHRGDQKMGEAQQESWAAVTPRRPGPSGAEPSL